MLDSCFLRPIAHRGLHDIARGVVENTAPAFEAAIAHGYGIECDLRPGKGGLPLVFHDDTLDRLVLGSGPVASLAAACARKLRFRAGGVVGILTFAEFISLVAGRVPLLVEVKSEWTAPDMSFLQQLAQTARGYAGPLALMSFDPNVMVALRELAPDVPRGLVSGAYHDENGAPWWETALSYVQRATLANLERLEAVAPAFIAYHVKGLPHRATTAAQMAGIPIFTWTVRAPEDWHVAAQYADAPIFEGAAPAL